MQLLHKIPYTLLIIASLTLGLAPFTPLPHLIEKVVMLAAGKLVKPVDIFDLLMHASPLALLAMKIAQDLLSHRKA